MNSRLIFGMYVEKASPVHKIDPRLKMVYMVSFSALIFTLATGREMAYFSIIAALLLVLSGIRMVELAKGLRPFYFMFIFILLMYVLFSPQDIRTGLVSLYRFLMLLVMSFILTYTTKISELVFSIEKLSGPLGIFGIKPRNIALMVSIAIRFIPVMILDMQRTRDAMLSRLAVFSRVKTIKIFMLALIEKMARSASNLSDALQSRLYDENIKIKKAMRLCLRDYLSIAVVIACFIVI